MRSAVGRATPSVLYSQLQRPSPAAGIAACTLLPAWRWLPTSGLPLAAPLAQGGRSLPPGVTVSIPNPPAGAGCSPSRAGVAPPPRRAAPPSDHGPPGVRHPRAVTTNHHTLRSHPLHRSSRNYKRGEPVVASITDVDATPKREAKPLSQSVSYKQAPSQKHRRVPGPSSRAYHHQPPEVSTVRLPSSLLGSSLDSLGPYLSRKGGPPSVEFVPLRIAVVSWNSHGCVECTSGTHGRGRGELGLQSRRGRVERRRHLAQRTRLYRRRRQQEEEDQVSEDIVRRAPFPSPLSRLMVARLTRPRRQDASCARPARSSVIGPSLPAPGVPATTAPVSTSRGRSLAVASASPSSSRPR